MKMSQLLNRENGNVFFTLFGAVALVGVVGATTMSIMKGPIKTMTNLNRQTVVETNLMAGMQVGMIAATTQQANDGDCDADTFVEPLPYRDGTTDPHPTGGGYIPNTIGVTKQDPWKTEYGYCVWDHGSVQDDAGCGGASQARLAGTDSAAFPAIAVISAGPNRVFETVCRTAADADLVVNGGNNDGILDTDEKLVDKPSGSDDIVLTYSYAEAAGSMGGLWSLKSGDPGTAEINKNVEFSGGLKMGTSEGTGGSVLDAVCVGPDNIGLMRFDPFASGGSGGIEVCDYVNSTYGWQAVGGGEADAITQDDGTETCTATDADSDGTPDDTGKVRYNTSNGSYEVCDGSIPGWREIIVGSTAATLVITPDTATIDVDGTSQTTSPRYSHTASPYVDITIQNIGSAAMGAAFASGDFVWSSNNNFEIVNNNCTGVTLTESGGAQDSCTLEIRAYAYIDESYSATLTVNLHNTPSLSLDGTASNACQGVGQALGGGIKVACHDTYDLIALPAGCADQAAVDTSTECTGTDWLKKQWTEVVACAGNCSYLGASSWDDGPSNVAIVLGDVAYAHPAVEYCDNLTTDATYDDWYLPAPNELSDLYAVKDIIGGTVMAEYHTSQDYSDSYARTIDLTDGTDHGGNKIESLFVRCVRRHSGGSTAPAPVPVTKPGYFVLTKNTYQGDFTLYSDETDGYDAADDICLNELLNNQWMGRENTVLNSYTVKAHIYDRKDQGSHEPSTRYYFAVAGDTSLGGAYFDTDVDRKGPGNEIAWNGTNYFGQITEYWTGRFGSDPADYWATATSYSSAGYNCGDWADSAGTGRFGNSSYTDNGRWYNGLAVENCTNEKHILCVVNPSSDPVTPEPELVEEPGYLVLTNAQYDGDLGGETGARDKCVTDLLNHDWRGRDNAVITTDNVDAMWINTNTLTPNATYYFAVSGYPGAGGAYIDVNSDGLGPGNTTSWDYANYFYGNKKYWTAVGNDTDTYWDTDSSAWRCNPSGGSYDTNFTTNDSGYTSYVGRSDATDHYRWQGTSYTCDDEHHLVCAVHPSGDEVTEDYTDPEANGPGYFVLTKNQYDGNLGGLAGADATCLDEVTNNNWMGRSDVALNSTTVRSFLCSESTCRNFLANQRYYFAVAGSPSIGGAWFETNSDREGPSNNYNWSGNNYFGGDKYYWQGYRSIVSSAAFDTALSSTGASCSSWSDNTTSYAGGRGHSNETAASRWRADITTTCDNTHYLACIVDPSTDEATAMPASPLDAGPGYFVMTSETYTGDLGTEASNRSLTGTGTDAADALCLKDLTDNDWYGRTGSTLNSTTVRAFICGDSTCNTMLPLQRYYFAKSGSPAINSSGLGYFDTGSTGVGPYNSDIWSDANHFGTSISYWAGRVNDGGTETSTYWALDQAGYRACSGWSDTTYSNGAGTGNTGMTDIARWRDTWSSDCSVARPLVCIVDPSSDAATEPPPAAPDYTCSSAGYCGAFTVDAGTTIRIKLWGGSGGGGGSETTDTSHSGGVGGGGGYVEFVYTPSVDKEYHVYVGGGGQGGSGTGTSNAAGGASYTGYIGGAGGAGTSYTTQGSGAGGGGASLIFDGDPSSGGTLVAVAGGGGGGAGASDSIGGNAGNAGGVGDFTTNYTYGLDGGDATVTGRGAGGGGGGGWDGADLGGSGTGGAVAGASTLSAEAGGGGSNYTIAGAVFSGSGRNPGNEDDTYRPSYAGYGGSAAVSGNAGAALIYIGE